MPAAALALAVLLHLLVGAGLWWFAPVRVDPEDEPIMVSFDSTPSNVGLQTPLREGPPPESVAASPLPSDEPQRATEPQEALAPSQPSLTPEPPPPSSPAAAEPQPQAVAAMPLFEFSVPPLPEPPPSPTSRDFPRRPPPAPSRPVQRTLPLPPRPAPATPYRPPTEAPAAMPAPLPGTAPADSLAGPGRQRNDYLSRVFRHLAPYRSSALTARAAGQRGRVVTRLTLARDGGLIDVSLDSSSGSPALDAAELSAIRSAAPFPPLPGNMPGDPVILILRMTY